ncbi:hypothetical protein HDU98_005911 [Podochytrium sp. JEL0797]|nr:hypothetical protein HDU98_005911 [Podochytrium sp. JEL0797]
MTSPVPSLRGGNSSQPREYVDAAATRLKTCKTIDSEIAAFFQERLALEAQYTKGLEQLSKKTLSVSNSQLGAFYDVWNKVLVSTAEESQVHHRFAVGLTEKVVAPLENFMDSDQEWRRARTYEVELARFLKEYDDKVKGLKKEGKGALGGFLKNLKMKKNEEMSPETVREIETANQAFVVKATPLILKFEEMDRSRKGALNNNIAQFCELYGKMVKPISEIPDRIFAASLGFDIEGDKKFFAGILGWENNTFDSHPVAGIARTDSVDVPPAEAAPAPAPLVDDEGFTIVPSNNTPPTWAAPAKAADFDSSEDEDHADTYELVSGV